MDSHHETAGSIQGGPLPRDVANDPLAPLLAAHGRVAGKPVLAGSREGLTQLSRLLARATDVAISARRLTGPLPPGSPGEVMRSAALALGPAELPRDGVGTEAALERVTRLLIEYGLDLTHPRAVAHLQPAPLSVAVVADALASMGNASLDTYDSGPSGIAVERWLIATLAKMAKLGASAGGVMTPGGSMSNLLALLLARDAAALRRGIDARRAGVGALSKPVVFCSELSHFSVHRACAALGLGEDAVLPVPTDARRCMQVDALGALLNDLGTSHTPIAIVATAGTTDFGSVDPLQAIADLARAHGVWLHVDAAYGFGALFSERLAEKLTGLERADSITLDLHKLGWQPAATSVLLVADTASFTALEREVAYLNPSDDAEAGLDGLLGRSLQTTRRPDALKVAATFLAEGQRGLGDMVDTCHALARHAEERIAAEPELELIAPANLTTVVFRFRCRHWLGERDQFENQVNGALRRRLLERGSALIGRTEVTPAGAHARPLVCLKFTLLNPTTTPEDLDELVQAILRAGREAERHLGDHLA